MPTLAQVLSLQQNPDVPRFYVAKATTSAKGTVTATLDGGATVTVPYLNPAPVRDDKILIMTTAAGTWCLGALGK